MAISEKIANLVVIHCTHILDIVFDTHCRVQTQTTVFILKLTPRCYLKFSIDLNILDLGKKPKYYMEKTHAHMKIACKLIK